MEHLAREHLLQRDEAIESMSRADGLKIVHGNLVESTELMTSHLRASQLACQDLESKLGRSESEMKELRNGMSVLEMTEKHLRSETQRLHSELEETAQHSEETMKLNTELKNYRRALQVSIEEIVERDDEILQKKSKIRTLSKEVDEVRDALRVVSSSSSSGGDRKERYLKGLIGSMHTPSS